ncbi:MAG: RNA-directed DNA polymerase [bacterium]|nr:RNA-directed DNA polymerase [bacterium]
MQELLSPVYKDATAESVLFQAWRKSAQYVRTHNWYADVLDLDMKALQIHDTLHKMRSTLSRPPFWKPTNLRIIPAPKSQMWSVENGKWRPQDDQVAAKSIRPLAHVGMEDQVVATAIMLCLADIVENAQGSPDLDISDPKNRQHVVSYGNRLYCESLGNRLWHPWGSSKSYRQFSVDYQTFLRRPTFVLHQAIVAHSNSKYEYATVHADLSKFYDRVTSQLLLEKIMHLVGSIADVNFYALIRNALRWGWEDARWPTKYADQNGIELFGKEVTLPQGLVAAGFFANIALLDFDKAVIESMGGEMEGTKCELLDYCRYVDDFRFVVRFPTNRDINEEDIAHDLETWIQHRLNSFAPGLKVSQSSAENSRELQKGNVTTKTRVVIEGRNRSYFVPQSKLAQRIQHQASGVLDMWQGVELIHAIEGFFQRQHRYHELSVRSGNVWKIGIPDMRDETAARFSAYKYRRTFRSLRLLLDDEPTTLRVGVEPKPHEPDPSGLVLTKQQLDDHARLFTLTLLNEWIENPVNVRLLRVALDMIPDPLLLTDVLSLTGFAAIEASDSDVERSVKQYCLSELFRAGATETGQVEDSEYLPSGSDIDSYHDLLVEEAVRIHNSYFGHIAGRDNIPWYLLQQVCLYLSVKNAWKEVDYVSRSDDRLLAPYLEFANYLKYPNSANSKLDWLFAALAASGYGQSEILSRIELTPEAFRRLAENTPSIALQWWSVHFETSNDWLHQVAVECGIEHVPNGNEMKTLVTSSATELNPFLSEVNVLKLAHFLITLHSQNIEDLSPLDIRYNQDESRPDVSSLKNIRSFAVAGSAFNRRMNPLPSWCKTADERRCYALGLLLRFAMRGSIDYLGRKQSLRHNQHRYSVPVTHWELLQYGGYHGRAAFGGDWIPISSWLENLFWRLLRWPGSNMKSGVSFAAVARAVESRLRRLESTDFHRGRYSNQLFLEKRVFWDKPRHRELSPTFRIAVVQSVLPSSKDFKDCAGDVQMNDPKIRKKNRQHLTSLINGLDQMLRVRKTHRGMSDELDFVMFPELAVHPGDVARVLEPFALRHRCVILAGLVYHPLRDEATPLTNSAIWLLPVFSKANGVQIRTIKQGKKYLAQSEVGIPGLASSRHVQWIIECNWRSRKTGSRPLRLSASICYDATDLELCADLRTRCDLYAVCAMNTDVGTFDRMAESIHYQMYQGYLVVNKGEFGGLKLLYAIW